MIVSVDELKTHLRLEHDEEDTYLSSLIAQAQAMAEDFCCTAFQDGTVPEPVRLAVLLMASHFYEIRDNYDQTSWNAVKGAFETLLWPYREPEKIL